MMDIRQAHPCGAQKVWAGNVQRLLCELKLDACPQAGEISEALAAFCQDRGRITDGGLSLLAARSFCAAGDREAAAAILRQNRRHRAHAGTWLDLLSAGGSFPELYPLFASRALRPQKTDSAGTLWLLDLDRIQRTAADRHELILCQAVRLLTEKISGVWEKSGGQGTLGIKGLSRLAGLIGGRRAGRLLLGHIHGTLRLCARRNGWSAVPTVLLFDL